MVKALSQLKQVLIFTLVNKNTSEKNKILAREALKIVRDWINEESGN